MMFLKNGQKLVEKKNQNHRQIYQTEKSYVIVCVFAVVVIVVSGVVNLKMAF